MKQMLNTAITLAAKYHDGQYDQGGMPYITHVLKVMHYCKTDDEELMCIAVLHDIVEDTPVTFADLTQLGMSERVVRGVGDLTKWKGFDDEIDLENYIQGIMLNKDAIIVKMADLRHNMDIRRLKGLRQKDFARLEKYAIMYSRLKEALDNWKD